MAERGTGSWPAAWIRGHRPGRPDPDTPIQVHHWDERTVVLRQSMAVHFEAPFLYLLFGNERALLLDTGATTEADRFPLRATVDGLMEAWLAEHPREGYELLVAHSHAHGDHVAADAQFGGRPSTTVVGHDIDAVRVAFGIDPWPGGEGSLDLGGGR